MIHDNYLESILDNCMKMTINKYYCEKLSKLTQHINDCESELNFTFFVKSHVSFEVFEHNGLLLLLICVLYSTMFAAFKIYYVSTPFLFHYDYSNYLLIH